MKDLKILDEADVSAAIEENPKLVKKWVIEAFKKHFQKKITQPEKVYLNLNRNPYDRIIALPCHIHGRNGAIGLKWIGSNSRNYLKGLERASALIILNNLKTKVPEAIVSGSLISTMRTFAMTQIMLDLFLQKSSVVGIIGMGRLGRMHAKLLPILYPNIEKIICFSNTAKFDDLIDEKKVLKATTLNQLLKTSNVLITASTANKPYIHEHQIHRDMYLAINLSLMDFDPKLIINSDYIIVDDWDQNISADKVFKQCVVSGKLCRDDVYEVGEVLFGSFVKGKGRIFVNPLGMGLLDIYVANKILKYVS